MTVGRVRSTRRHSLRNLFFIFAIWKALLLLLAYASPGVGYDTSSDLLNREGQQFVDFQDVPTAVNHGLLKFVRWDAMYFTQLARYGHVFEQEWAFGKGISTVLALTIQAFGLRDSNNIIYYTVAGILVSHLTHWLSVMCLFSTACILETTSRSKSTTAFVAATLHIISPAGIFLSVPYTEALFSFLNMLGFYLYAKSTGATDKDSEAASLIYTLMSGIAFGFATAVRGNGILSGIVFFLDAIETGLQLINWSIDISAKPRLLVRLQFIILAGLSVAMGMFVPQFLAFREYCMLGPGDRPWCNSWLPSIFAFVQSHYWNVGFLKYWTFPNLPLFLMASPSLYAVIVSGVLGIGPALSPKSTALQRLRMRLALVQLVLALLALTSYHVQIITRLSSGYPLWYIWLAARLGDRDGSGFLIRALTIYGLVQVGLFASFLPPA